ncbi:putative leader peptide [Streptomyces sp. NPDC093516]
MPVHPDAAPLRPPRSVTPLTVTVRPHGDSELTGPGDHGVLRCVTDTCVRLWRRVHMDLLRYAGCVCRPSC